MTKQADYPLRIRVPPDIKAWLLSQAKRNERSQNGEVIFSLRERMLQAELSGASGSLVNSNAPAY